MADTSNYIYLAMCPHYYGIGKDQKTAMRNCRAIGGSHAATMIKKHGYQIYRVHPEFKVNHHGDVFTPKDHPAIMVKDTAKKKESTG